MNMACANRDCKAELKYLRGGRLFLMERQPNLPSALSSDQVPPKRPVTMRRYFWLCESCSQTHAIQRWTDAGIELVSRDLPKRIPPRALRDPQGWIAPGLVG